MIIMIMLCLQCYLDGVLNNNNANGDLYLRVIDTDHVRSNRARCDPVILVSC